MKILLLDDNSDALMVLDNFLKALGHNVSAHTDPLEALLWLNDVKPQIIIADLQMPVMDGFKFVQSVRARGAYAKVPIICITGTDTPEEVISAHGFQAVLRKPTTLSDIMAAIEHVTTGAVTIAAPAEAEPMATGSDAHMISGTDPTPLPGSVPVPLASTGADTP